MALHPFQPPAQTRQRNWVGILPTLVCDTGKRHVDDSDSSRSKHVASKPNPEHVEDKDAQENEGGGY